MSFHERLAESQIALDEGDVERLGHYLAMLEAINEVMNLTRITDHEDMWLRHIGDSLTLLPMIASAEAGRVLDVGSGGGLPGIPLAITMPDVQFTLLEATGKKARALEAMVDRLGLSNVVVVNDRAESLGHDRQVHREQYDIVTARAVGPLRILLELTIPFVKIDGHLLAIKGEKAPVEIEASKHALHALHCHVVDSIRTESGTIVLVEKTRKTPRIYPRRPGEPRRAPL